MKNKGKIIISFILGLIIATGVYAANTYNSKDISYTNGSSKVNNVSDAVDELYNKSLSEINALKEKYKNIDYLADVAQIGDYVAYDAGTWTTSADKPTSQGEFGGYIEGENKANSVEWCYQANYTTSLKGWRVFSVDKSTKTVTLIHAGQPECYYHESGYSSQSETNLNTRATSEYLNTDYAESAHAMNKEEAVQNVLKETGDFYWLAKAGSTDFHLWHVDYDGTVEDGYHGYNFSFGIRPVIVLKSNILTTGKGIDMVEQEAWTLVKP